MPITKYRTEYAKIEPYITKDGSIIRELMHPSSHENMNQSLAEAIIPAEQGTHLHKHEVAEEIYYIIEGAGMMTLASEEFKVKEGDAIVISPGTPHKIQNTGRLPLKILCCCAPAYSHNDTELLE
ncbi:MAG: cupin domain-containing protein [Methanosarcina sp.]